MLNEPIGNLRIFPTAEFRLIEPEGPSSRHNRSAGERKFGRVLQRQRMAARNLPWLGSGAHALQVFDDESPRHRADKMIFLDADTVPTVGDVVLTIPDSGYTEEMMTRAREIWKHVPTMARPTYIASRIVSFTATGGFRGETLISDARREVRAVSPRELDFAQYERALAQRDDPTGRLRFTVIEGIILNAAEVGFPEAERARYVDGASFFRQLCSGAATRSDVTLPRAPHAWRPR